MTLRPPRALTVLGLAALGAVGLPLVGRAQTSEFSASADPGDLSCNAANGGTCDGTLAVVIAGGVAPYTLTFEGAAETGLAPIEVRDAPGTARFTGLCPGQFTISVSDADGVRIDLGNQAIGEPTAVDVDLVAVTPLTEAGAATGAIDVEVAGGTPPYTYAWSHGAATEDVDGLAEGGYRLTVSDAAGCAFTTPEFAVGRLAVFSAVVTDASCGDKRDGGVDIAVGGAAGPFSYAWSNGVTTQDLVTAPAGDYAVTITDEASGVQITERYTIGSTSDLAVVAEVLTDFNGAAISCAGADDAAVFATVSGGRGAVSLEWSNGATDAEQRDLGPGRYTAVVRDESGCVGRSSVTVPAVDTLKLDLQVDQITCPGEQDGRLTARATGGTGRVSYAWSDGIVGQRRVGLPGGDYAVTITDANGCTAEEAAIIAVPLPLEVDYAITPATTLSPGSITIAMSGGTEPYQASWANRPSADGALALDDLPYGKYSVTVSDVNGCESVSLDLRIPNEDFECFDAVDVLTPGLLDGLNDVLRINCLGDFPDNVVEVYDRYGERVYGAAGYDNEAVAFGGLDAAGEPLTAGAYYYVVRYRDADGAQRVHQGSVTVVR